MLVERPQSGRSHFTPLTTAAFLGLVRRLHLNPMPPRFVKTRYSGIFASREKSQISGKSRHRTTPQMTEDKQSMRKKDLTDFDDLPNAAHVDVNVVAALFGCKPPTIWSRLRRNELPQPKKFGSHTRWNVGELRAALNIR